jgi:Beta-eliminating lyase
VDGAQIFNAAVALDIPAAELVADADSVFFALSKGLSAGLGVSPAETNFVMIDTAGWGTGGRRGGRGTGGGIWLDAQQNDT